MSSFQVINESAANCNHFRVKMKQSLMMNEISKLKVAESNAKRIAAMVKSLQNHFRKGEGQSQQKYLLRCKEMLSKLLDEIKATHHDFSLDNTTYTEEIESKHNLKSIQQSFFMTFMRNYEEKNLQLASKIKVLEESLRYYQQNSHLISNEQEQFSERLSSLQFLDDVVALEQQKEKMIHELVELGHRLKLKSAQEYCRACIKSIGNEQICQNILLKEKILNHNLRSKISSLQRQNQVQKQRLYQYTKAIKKTKQQINRINLQISINSCNNFLLQSDHYSLYWKQMKESINHHLSLNLPTLNGLKKSKSCTIMQSNLLNKQNTALEFNSSLSIENEESLLDNLDYFISQNFIKDLPDHSL